MQKALLALFLMTGFHSMAYNVTQLKATYRDGQVCLAWNSPEATNLKYNIYRSKTQFTSADQFNVSNYIGYVRDSSSKNIRRSRIEQTPIYYKWDPAGLPLCADVGIYVVTCNEESSFYYAVTITDLTTGVEDLYLKVNKNVTYYAVQEYVADPQPVLQDSVIWKSGETVYMYTQFGNNQNTVTQPAFNNCGSFGYNFFMIRKGDVSDKAPVYIFYEGLEANALVGNGLNAFADVANCYILSMDDWSPYPDGYGPTAGRNTGWFGYHEGYDMYSANNAIPTSGIVKAYTQTRLIHSINWARKYLPNADSTRLYLIGVSAGGYAVLITANLIPDKIAAVYSVASPSRLESGDGIHEAMWGNVAVNLQSDRLSPDGTNPMKIFDAMNSKFLLSRNINKSLPLIFTVHGKKDYTIGWKDKPGFYDTIQLGKHGSIMYWDQREHDGSKALFLDSETMPVFKNFATNISYPAFSNCSINHNPGNGRRNNGDSYGTINGYLQWDSIQDESCYYSVRLSIKDFVAGGCLDAQQYETCSTDVTLRRLQNFRPDSEATIHWENLTADGSIVQSGTLINSAGNLITLENIMINKSGTKLNFSYGNCVEKISYESSSKNIDVNYVRTGNGWEAHLHSSGSEVVSFQVFNTLGQQVYSKTIYLQAGYNSFNIDLDHSKIYMAVLKGNEWSNVTKLAY